ncbi:TAXI family TRAP transporter solute-binding subunit [Streptomyces sp. NBC_01142]|uniref:TAXI family TRAP transporter solute-binding subunit n=1 Tax=Streptomyces sp. NBC_01142 TaxID=2975865 RepID=UPI00225B6D93|nr:TAXI family TRAP transporter solute-binding subunit [Streptomyces sp. NBC_01142]MCX4825833.1 TAXI family TRAP transporter solute-binding subunit [Streptomyces sp. NBC_01142]
MRVAHLLAAALALVLLPTACTGSDTPNRPSGEITVATGNPGGVYAEYGAGYADVIGRRLPDASARVLHTGGSVDNLRQIDAGQAEAGFTLADAAADAVGGRTPFSRPLRVVALAALYDNYVQLVVRADSPVRSAKALRGLRVAVGSEGSGTALIAERILKVSGLSPEKDLTSLRLDVRESATALAAKRIDAFFWSGGLPTGAITELRRSTEIRLVDLGDVVGELTRSYGELYTETTVPAVVYGARSAVTTVSVPNFLVVRRDMKDSEAYWLTRLLFEGQSQLIRAHPEARRLDRRTAIATHPLELHPGAARWYRESHP